MSKPTSKSTPKPKVSSKTQSVLNAYKEYKVLDGVFSIDSNNKRTLSDDQTIVDTTLGDMMGRMERSESAIIETTKSQQTISTLLYGSIIVGVLGIITIAISIGAIVIQIYSASSFSEKYNEQKNKIENISEDISDVNGKISDLNGIINATLIKGYSRTGSGQ